MTGSLLVETRRADGDWVTVGRLTVASPMGSMSNNLPDGGRDVIMFECAGGYSVICRSLAGVDFEAGPPGSPRVIDAVAVEELARLEPGQSYEMPVTTDRGISVMVRWTQSSHGGDSE
jgi:hypothetical protein